MRHPVLGLLALALGSGFLFLYEVSRPSPFSGVDVFSYGGPEQVNDLLIGLGSEPLQRFSRVIACEWNKFWPGTGLYLPSILSGVFLVLATACMGRFLRSWRTGFAAGVLLATTFGFWGDCRTELWFVPDALLQMGALGAMLLAAAKGRAWGWSLGGILLAAAVLGVGWSGMVGPILLMGGWGFTLGKGSSFPWRGLAWASLLALAWVIFGYGFQLALYLPLSEVMSCIPDWYSDDRYGWTNWMLLCWMPWMWLLPPAIFARLPKRWKGGKAEGFLLFWLFVAVVLHVTPDPWLMSFYALPPAALMMARMLDGRFGDEPDCAPWAGNLMWAFPPVILLVSLWGLPEAAHLGLLSDRTPSVWKALYGVQALTAVLTALALWRGWFWGIVGGPALASAILLLSTARFGP